MNNKTFGNVITDNALIADEGTELIKQALSDIESKYGWEPVDVKPLFAGVYYDTKKVGSFITKVKNDKNETAVLKLQLRYLPFDEGFIIRYIEKQNKSSIIRLPKILQDEAWNEKLGYGYLIFEDLSHIPNLWSKIPVPEKEMKLHKIFLKEFFTNVLPIKPWLPKPKISSQQAYKESFEHFYSIAKQSSHHHIKDNEILEFKKKYYEIIGHCQFEDIHFTHAHLSGGDVKHDKKNNKFILLANLDWSFRPKYKEITFPIWIELILTRNPNFTFDDLLKRVEKWTQLWSKDLYDHDPSERQQYWFNLLERSMMTIMLDLGSSEWKKDEEKEMQALFNAWKEFFQWLINNKL